MARLILIALFLISAAPLHHADYQRCVIVRLPPIDDGHENPLEGNAPISDLAKWAR